MLTDEQIGNWFTYHPPTPGTSPKYEAIRAAESAAGEPIVAILNGGTLATYDDVNARCAAFVKAIDANAPDGADKSSAVLFVRLARMTANEAIALLRKDAAERPDGGAKWEHPSYNVTMLCREVESDLRRARWLACAAIACAS